MLGLSEGDHAYSEGDPGNMWGVGQLTSFTERKKGLFMISLRSAILSLGK